MTESSEDDTGVMYCTTFLEYRRRRWECRFYLISCRKISCITITTLFLLRQSGTPGFRKKVFIVSRGLNLNSKFSVKKYTYVKDIKFISSAAIPINPAQITNTNNGLERFGRGVN
ncbi:hypothetical protein J6590_007531 [Homalodisca vitripennis]|nr:hypothetical protein J6590_007529 [Homalodisca vitripennis]KAG8293864.1 hypothetical protein J6590_007531 [Homalodisca vitripennis]